MLNVLCSSHGVNWEQLEQEIAGDKELQQIVNDLSTGQKDHFGFSLRRSV